MTFAALLLENHPYLFDFSWHFLGREWGLRYYSLAYLFGFFVCYLGMHWQARCGWSRLRETDIADYITWIALAGVILGGRLGYCLLYAPQETFANPLFIFQLWTGGMASHGGILGVIFVMIFYARAKKIPFYNLADASALFVPLTLGLGRCANFMNGELWGRPTGTDWGMIFPDAPLVQGLNVARYPSQLFEAGLEGLVLQILLLAVRCNTKREGAVALSFMAGYAILRIIGEQFREPDAQIGFWFGSITQGQLLSGLMLTITAFLVYGQFGRKLKKT